MPATQHEAWEMSTCMTCKALALMLDPESLYCDETDIALDYFATR